MALRKLLARVTSDISTTSAGDFDPARIIGYGITILGGLIFCGLTIYDTMINSKFDYDGFAIGLAGVSATIAAAAAGVWIKRSTEKAEPTAENNRERDMSVLDNELSNEVAVGAFNLYQIFRIYFQDEATISTLIKTVADYSRAVYESTGRVFTPTYRLVVVGNAVLVIEIINAGMDIDNALHVTFADGIFVNAETVKKVPV